MFAHDSIRYCKFQSRCRPRLLEEKASQIFGWSSSKTPGPQSFTEQSLLRCSSREDTSLDNYAGRNPFEEPDPRFEDKVLKKRRSSKRKKKVLNAQRLKPRFGLPEGFTPRLQQYGRSVLLEDNIYSLPSGQEFVSKYPTGTLGKLGHLYAINR